MASDKNNQVVGCHDQQQLQLQQQQHQQLRTYQKQHLPQQQDSERHHLNLYYHNSGGMRSKSNNFYLSVVESEYDIIVITETWFVQSIKSEEFFPMSYNVFRKDRYVDSVATQRGGGVLIAVNNSLKCELVEFDSMGFELIAVKIRHRENYLYICVLYTQPGESFQFFNRLVQLVDSKIMTKLEPMDNIIFLGDFNFPKVMWSTVDDFFTPFNTTETSSLVFDYFFGAGLFQHNQVVNRNNRLLDLVFASSDVISSIAACEDLCGTESIHHTPIHVDLSFMCCNTIEFKNDIVYDFRRGDYASLDSFLESESWDFLSDGGDLDEMLNKFYHVLRTGIDRFIPTKRSVNSYREPWFNKELANLRNRKSRAHKRYRFSGCNSDYQVFERLRYQFKTLNRFLYGNYILDIEAQLTSSPKRFWSYVASKRKHNGFPSPMVHEQHSATGVEEVCDLFARFFKTVYRDNPAHVNSRDDCAVLGRGYLNVSFTVEQILEGLQSLDGEKSAGPDKIPPRVIKECSFSLCEPLAFLFNLSVRRGYFPDFWKSSYITPVFKSGSRNRVSNYRGIAILSAIPKLFERLVRDALLFHCKKFISPNQHGFYPGRSTTTNLVILTNYLTSSVEKGSQVDVIYTDFSKAFDRIDHELLIEKLIKLDTEFIPIQWISSYLSNRKQFVRIGEYTSEMIDVSSGIPQGSHLGPLLFTLFIDDVLNCFSSCHCLMYADDLKIYTCINGDEDVLNLKYDLATFSEWTLTNRLELNINKCKIMTFSRSRHQILESYELNGLAIARTLSMLDLGILFTHNLDFSRHIECIIAKANSMLGFLFRNTKDFQDPYTLRALYVSFVRSQLEYASVVWCPYHDLQSGRIESIQKRFLVYALRRFPRNRDSFVLPPYEGRCALLGLQTLKARRKIAGAMFCRDTLAGRLDCAEVLALYDINVPERILRPRGLMVQRFHRTDYGRNEPIARTSRLLDFVGGDFDFVLSRNEFRNLISSSL